MSFKFYKELSQYLSPEVLQDYIVNDYIVNEDASFQTNIISNKNMLSQKCNSDNNDIVNIISSNIKQHNSFHNEMMIKCLKILKLYPPAKNEFKFLYGNLIQMCVIDMLDSIFYSCYDLDKLHSNGSEYKNDCILNITNMSSINLSIKAKKNRNGKVIIINKLNNDKQYDLCNLITIIVILELKDIIIIPHRIIPINYIENNDSNISYKSSLFSYLYKTKEYQKYIVHLDENNKFKEFYINEYPKIIPHDIYKELYNKL
jgi:hypothetical protein